MAHGHQSNVDRGVPCNNVLLRNHGLHLRHQPNYNLHVFLNWYGWRTLLLGKSHSSIRINLDQIDLTLTRRRGLFFSKIPKSDN